MRNLITISTLIFLSSCYDYDDFNSIRERELLPSVDFIPSQIVNANGSDTILVKVIFPLESNRDLVTVNFMTDEGVFIESGTKAYSSSEVFLENNKLNISARLRASTKAGEYSITIEVPNVFKSVRQFRLMEVLPNSIRVDKNKFSVGRGYSDEIQLIASLGSERGKPSQGTTVEFVVNDSLSSNTSNLFRGLTTTDANGTAIVFFTPGNEFGNSFTGEVSFKASSSGPNGNIESKEEVFQIVDPD